MNILLYFALGVIFISFIQPLLDSILSLILSYIELLKMKVSLKITQYNEKIHEIVEPKNEKDTRILGFVCEEDVTNDELL